MKKCLETINYIHFSPKCCKCFHLGLASKRLELRPRRKKDMLWCETEPKILSDDLMKSWWMSSKYLEAIHLRFESKAWPVDFPLPSLIIPRIPSSRCLWSLAISHIGSNLLVLICFPSFDDFKTFMIWFSFNFPKKAMFFQEKLLYFEWSPPWHVGNEEKQATKAGSCVSCPLISSHMKPPGLAMGSEVPCVTSLLPA